MKVPEMVLAGMRKTNDLFCSSVVRGRDMSALEQVYTPSVITLNPAIRDQVKSGHREWPKT